MVKADEPGQRGSGLDSRESIKKIMDIWLMSWLMHPWYVWPKIDYKSLMVGRKNSTQIKHFISWLVGHSKKAHSNKLLDEVAWLLA